MIEIREGNIFDSTCQTLVNPINCCGTMGKGLALLFKKRFPEMNADYVQRCTEKKVEIGVPYLYRGTGLPWVVNFPTKTHWRAKSRLEHIQVGIQYLQRNYIQWQITSIAIPALGCGLGGLQWKNALPAIYQQLLGFTIHIELFCPSSSTVNQSLKIIQCQ